MIKLNDNFGNLPAVYLFTQISRRLAQYREEPGSVPLIRMDIGDIPGPIPSAATAAMHKAIDDLSGVEEFKGYGPEQGYAFLRNVIAEKDYCDHGMNIKPSEIFVGDGAKCDLGNLGDILSRNCRIAVMNPSYPAYLDDNAIDGRTGKLIDGRYSEVVYLRSPESNSFYPLLPDRDVDIIYICSPNNPTGIPLPHDELKKWVDFAREKKCLIIFDSAYEAYIRDSRLPRSIYEIEGAKEIAIEVRSYSKTGGFTGVRCGYTVVPDDLKGFFADGSEEKMNVLWSRRQTTKFNGASYVSQRGAEALYSEEGRREVREMTDRYLSNAKMLRQTFESAGWKVTGGTDSPYVWAGSPFEMKSAEIFENLLTECGVSTTPGVGFGSEGEGFIRLSGFNSRENTMRAIERMTQWLRKQ